MRIDNPVGSEAQLTGSFSGSFLGDGSNIFNIVSASNSLTASYVAFSNVANKPTLISSSAQIADQISGSFTSTSASIATDIENLKSDSGSFSTRVTNLENFSSSLNSTYATDSELAAATASLSSSVALLSSSFEALASTYNSGSFSGSFQGNGSNITGVISSSYSQTSSYSLGVDFDNIQNLPAGLISASAQLSNTTIPGNLTIGGTLTAEQFYTEYVTSSVIYKSGSTKFGDTSDDTHQFTGSVRVLGGITGSLLGTATTASYVAFSNVANKPTLLSGSAQIADEISGSFTSASSSIASDIVDISSSVALLSGSHLSVSSSFVSFKASYATGSFTGSFFGNGAGILGVVTSSHAITASYVDLVGVDGFAAVSTSLEDRLTGLEGFSSSINATFATDAELAQATASLSASISLLSGSFLAFNSSYNSGSFSGSFDGDGSGLTGVSATASFATIITVHNLEPGIVEKGTPLYLIMPPFLNTTAKIGALIADADDPSRMPAGAVLLERLFPNGVAKAIINGFVDGVIGTDNFTEGDEIFVAAGGGYVTNIAPTGSALVQKLGTVGKVAISGSAVINGAGTFRAVPNIEPGNVFVGSNNHVPITVSTGSFYTGSYSGSFEGEGSRITGIVSSSYSETSSYSLGLLYSNIIDTPVGILSSSAQIADEISGSFTSVSESFAIAITGLVSDSGSFSTRVTSLENFSSSLNATFATDQELAQATASLSSSIASLSGSHSALSSSYASFVQTYNSGSFTGSFIGDGSGLVGVLASSAQNTVITVKNLSGAVIAKGTPLYLTASGNSGNLSGAYPANAGNPARMPAGAIAGESLAIGAEGVGLVNGFIQGVNTTGFTSGVEVFVAVGGGYTQTAPTGSALVQKLGNIEKVGANGSGVINGPGEARSMPNIQPGRVFVGGNNHVPITVSTGSFYTGSYTGSFKGDGSQVLGVVSSSYSLTSSYSLGVDYANIIGTPEGLISGSAQLANTTIPGNLTIDGTLTAQQFYTQYVTSSVIYKSGSTKFGDTADDVHEFTGSIKVFGSVSGSFSGSFQGNGSLLTNLNVPAGVYKYTGSANNSILPISGGNITSATSDYSVIAGGFENTMASDYSVIGGGLYNQATGDSAGILGGSSNIASGANSAIAGGVSNTASGTNSFIGGGGYGTASGYGSVVVGGGSAIAGPGFDDGLNNATGFHSIVGGGNSNKAAAGYSSVLGGHVNIASGSYSTIGGGCSNSVTGACSTVSGGTKNIASGGTSTIGGGSCNTSSGICSTISGGFKNTASACYATVSGGSWNTASGYASTVAGGGAGGGLFENRASNGYATVGGGGGNTASGYNSTIGGGFLNTACSNATTVSGGYGNSACGICSVVAGGKSNTALAAHSTVGGGTTNQSNSACSTIGGGQQNTITSTGACSFIGGGRCNTIQGLASTVTGGCGNIASGDCSGILGGATNNTCTFANSFIVGSNICATAACYTFMNNTCTLGTTRTQTLVETSAKKHKRDINPLGSQLQNVTALNPVEFTWKESNKKDIGLIAEEVDKIYPELVSREENGDIHGINYSKITAVLIKAVQEQQKQIEELKLEVQKLKGL